MSIIQFRPEYLTADLKLKFWIRKNTNECNCSGHSFTKQFFVGKQVVDVPDFVIYRGQKYNVVGMDAGCFDLCYNLHTVNVGKNVREIGSAGTEMLCETGPNDFRIFRLSFVNCSTVARIEVHKDNKYFSSKDGVLFDKSQKFLLFFPPANSTEYHIPDGVTQIWKGAFHEFAILDSLYIPQTVAVINSEAISYCKHLRHVYFESPQPPKISEKSFYKLSRHIRFHVPKGSRLDYVNALHSESVTDDL